ncbi:MAG TPA: DsbA family protein [Burkholderiaceae bacterium]|jgi:2-hydroxychromene-2-carboxylate isomerase|nr:DsbA family protein [Burkholderiaceae bacterium]
MSIKTLLMPMISERLLSRKRLLKLRARSERKRVANRQRHQVHYFHQIDDPYSALTAQVLPQLLSRYDIELIPHIVGAPPADAAPERDKLIAYSRRDAQLLAQHHGLNFRDPGAQPASQAQEDAAALLVAAIDKHDFTKIVGSVSTRLWENGSSVAEVALQRADREAVSAHIEAANQLRQRLGHYLGATFFYGGEWYWGIDRLYHLEKRLQELDAQSTGVSGLMFPPSVDLSVALKIANPPIIDFFFSLRSPYSAIVAPRVFDLAERTGAQVRLRFVLPMVMRGLPVPPNKSNYIILDCAREAFERSIPFGRVNDPRGRPTERGLSLIPLALRVGKGQAYILSVMHGIWAEGIDIGSDKGLRKVVERVGLSWADACLALQDEDWRKTAEENRVEMFELGLWGVPSFHVRDTVVWGQDRLWAVEDVILTLRDTQLECNSA